MKNFDKTHTTKLFGTLNLTPDSFSDGGLYNNAKNAFEKAEIMAGQGVYAIDVGAESTRPDAKTITADEEWNRLKDFFEIVKNQNFKTLISLDSRNSETIAKALDYGINFINDVSGFADEKIINLAAKYHVKAIFMHSLSVPASKEKLLPEELEIINFLKNWALEKIKFLQEKGIKKENLIFDAGLGFGKTMQQNWDIVGQAEKFHDLNIEILLGHSEKSFLTKYSDKPAGQRLAETTRVSKILASKKIQYLRVHNVAENLSILL